MPDFDAPLSEVATVNRQRDALYRLSERLHRADSAETIYSAALDGTDKRWVVESVIKKEIRTADTGVAEVANADVKTETEE